MAGKLRLIAVLVHAVRAARVQDLDLRSDEQTMTYEDHANDFLRSVLEGTWSTDYLTKDPVRITSLAGESRDFLHGSDAVLDHYRAECAHFGAGRGVRYLTISKTLALNAGLGVPVAVIIQRVDRTKSVHHVGKLYLEETSHELRWVIEWEHVRPLASEHHRWWRAAVNAADAPKGEPDEEAKAKQAEMLSVALVKQWDEDCREGLTGLLQFSAAVSLTLSVGVASGGVSATLSASIGLDVDTVQRNRDRIMCMLQKMGDFASDKNDALGTGQQSRLEQGLKFLGTYVGSMEVACLPSLSLGLSFNVVPYPPYLWPVPELEFSIGWAKSLKGIRECVTHPELGDIITEAQGATPAEADLEGTATSVRDAGMGRAISLGADFAQGPSFTIFPPAIGWWWGMELSLAISTRRLLKGLRELRCTGSSCRSRCELDKQELYISIASWAKATKRLVDARSGKCGTVMSIFANIRAKHGDKFDPEANPFTAVPYLEQLGSAEGRRADGRSFSLGGGIAYVGTDGVQVGIFETFSAAASSRDRDYEHECQEYADFVNIYRKRVEPALADTQSSCASSERVNVAQMPPMNYHSCSSVPLGVGPVFPSSSTPTDVVSQCETCLLVSSYGMPCSFCAGVVGNICRQFFDSTGLVACPVGSAALPLEQFELRRREDASAAAAARHLCFAAGGRKAGR